MIGTTTQACMQFGEENVQNTKTSLSDTVSSDLAPPCRRYAPRRLSTVSILIPRAHDPPGLRQGSRALAGFKPGRSVNHGLPVLLRKLRSLKQ